MLDKLETIFERLVSFSSLTDSEEKDIKECILWIEENLKIKSEYILYLESFNKITGKKYPSDPDSRKAYYEKVGFYSLEDRIKVIKNIITDPWFKNNSTILTPAYILQDKITAKYISYTPPTETIILKPKTNEGSYSEVQNF